MEGYLELVPLATQTGDRVVVVFGCELPLVVRKVGEG